MGYSSGIDPLLSSLFHAATFGDISKAAAAAAADNLAINSPQSGSGNKTYKCTNLQLCVSVCMCVCVSACECISGIYNANE